MVTVKIEEREQLYMIGISVNRLKLSNEKVEKNSEQLDVHIKFLDIPGFVIKSEDNQFGSGKSCVFSRKPTDLIEKLSSNPLTIEVRPIINDFCESEQENAMCRAVVELSGCFCQIEAAMRNPQIVPEPYTIINSFDLLDENKKCSGSIELFLKLSCLGESIVTCFHVNDKALLFKNINSIDGFSCTKLPSTENETKNKFWTPKSEVIHVEKNVDAKIIAGIAPICDRLIGNDNKINIPRLSLEKLEGKNNDIPIIEEPANVSKEVLNSSLGSANKESTNQSNINSNEKLRDFIENCEEKSVIDSKIFLSTRKFPCSGKFCAGGICSRFSSSANDILNRKNVYKSRGLEVNRLRGGMDLNFSTIPIQSVQTLLTGACRTYAPSEDSRPGCGCQGMPSKMKKKCCGIDCLIKSFKEAEQFVDRIGRVPGMAGLGLMDPTESPFFGRHRAKIPTKCREFRSSQVRLPLARKSSLIVRKIPSTLIEKTYTPLKKMKRDEEKIPPSDLTTIKEPQAGPCGEEICKSRKKQQDESEVSSRERSLRIRKLSSVSTKRKNRKLNLKRVMNLRNYERNYGHIKVGKRMMRLVEATSQRCCYGHRSCVELRVRVPGNMGWLWNTSRTPGSVKPRIGWRPGAISKGVWKIFEKSKTAKDLEDIVEERRILPAVKGKKGKMAKSKSLLSLARSQKKRREKDEGSELPPTLHLHRKNGDYYITMHPVNPENSPEIQAEVKPLQFKVARNRNGNDDSADSSSVGDDMEIEYSPPTAIHRLEKKAERRDLETQVVQNDIIEAFKGSGGGAAGPKKKKKGGKK